MQTNSTAERTPGSLHPAGSARRDKTRIVLTLLQIVLLPVCTAIAKGDVAKGCLAVATMMFMLRIYLETMEAPNGQALPQGGAKKGNDEH